MWCWWLVVFLNAKVIDSEPKLASNSWAMLTWGGFPVAFCITRKSFVTISMTWPVCKTKSPLRRLLLSVEDDKHPGIFVLYCERVSLVGLAYKISRYHNISKIHGIRTLFLITALTWNTAISSENGLSDNLKMSAAGILYLICIVLWSITNMELVEMTKRIGTNCNQWNRLVILKVFLNEAHKDYLSTRSCYFVNDISKHNILVITLLADFLPLGILSQPNIVTKKRMTYAIKGKQTNLVSYWIKLKKNQF